MTSRPGNLALEELLWHRGKRLCTLLSIIRRDGDVLRVTDHDRPLTFEGAVYSPVLLGALSAERREAAFRAGNQEARGIIDGETITLQDIDGKLYHGAEVRQVITSWDRPWAWTRRDRKWIRTINRTGSTWTGTLEGRTQTLQRTSGGRFGGAFSTTCQYRLGDPLTCGKDISALIRTARVTTITDDRLQFACSTVAWPTATSDDYYRGGEVEWRWAEDERNVIVQGLSTSSGTTTTLNDSGGGWTINEHVGRRVVVTTADYADVVEYSYITANTATQLTFSPALSTAYGAGAHYQITARGISSAATASTLTDSTADWEVDEHAGKQLRILGAPFGEALADTTILSNTATELTVDDPTGFTGSGLTYDICPRSPNWGTVSSIARHVDSTRTLELLTPTPFPITAKSGGWVRPGCDGLLSTCISKFANGSRHGGDPHAPSANQIIEPPT